MCRIPLDGFERVRAQGVYLILQALAYMRDLSRVICGGTGPATDQGTVLLALSLLNDLIGHGLRHLSIGVEGHREHCATAGLRPQVTNVPEHL